MSQEPSIYTQEWMREEAKRLIEWTKKPESIFYKGFCAERGYGAQRLAEFSKKCPEFAEAMEFADTWQEQKLVTQSFWRKGDAGMAKFILINKHGYREQPHKEESFAQQYASIDGTSKDLINGK